MKLALRIAFTILGLAVMAVGMVWMLEGAGYLPWPEDSTMINQMRWAYIGAPVGLAGLAMMFLARHIR